MNALIHWEPVLLPDSELKDKSGVIRGILRSGCIKKSENGVLSWLTNIAELAIKKISENYEGFLRGQLQIKIFKMLTWWN